MALVLVLAGTFVYLRVASDLSSSLDDGLRTRADDLARQIQEAGVQGVGIGGPRSEGGEDILTEVLRPDGTVVASSEALGSQPVLGAAQLEQARGGLTYFDAGEVPGIEQEARLLSRPVETGGSTFIIVVGASTGDRAETLSGLVATFAIGGPLALLLASALGYGLATLAMRPVEAMRARAGRITLERSGERLPLPASTDEISHLGQTLNEMLERIETSIERERAFVSDSSHELRTPLAVLRGELELGLRPGRSDAEIRAAMLSAGEEVDRLQGLTDDLLALARAEDGRSALDVSEVLVGELVERVSRRFATIAAGSDREIQARVAPALVFALDAARIERALGNLIENALRHGDGRVIVSAESRDGGLLLAVADAGQGFPAPFVPRAFDRFSRAEAGRTSAGTGLGLSIVRAIVDAHAGSVAIEPGDDRGARVVIELPRPKRGEPR